MDDKLASASDATLGLRRKCDCWLVGWCILCKDLHRVNCEAAKRIAARTRAKSVVRYVLYRELGVRKRVDRDLYGCFEGWWFRQIWKDREIRKAFFTPIALLSHV